MRRRHFSKHTWCTALHAVQVRELDTAQSRIHATLARINIVVDRTAAINGVRAALDMEDYEAAARHVQAFLALEQRFGPIHDEHDSKQAQEQRRVRRACCAHCAALRAHVGFTACCNPEPVGRTLY